MFNNEFNRHKKHTGTAEFQQKQHKGIENGTALAAWHNASIQLLHITDNDYDLFASDAHLELPHFSEATKRLRVFARSII